MDITTFTIDTDLFTPVVTEARLAWDVNDNGEIYSDAIECPCGNTCDWYGFAPIRLNAVGNPHEFIVCGRCGIVFESHDIPDASTIKAVAPRTFDGELATFEAYGIPVGGVDIKAWVYVDRVNAYVPVGTEMPLSDVNVGMVIEFDLDAPELDGRGNLVGTVTHKVIARVTDHTTGMSRLGNMGIVVESCVTCERSHVLSRYTFVRVTNN